MKCLVATLLLAGLTMFGARIAQAAPNQPLVPGTMLVFPEFDIQGDSRTQLRIINTGAREIRFHYNYVCPGIPRGNDTCAKSDRTKSLTPHQTLVLDVASENPPCERGFVIGYAVDRATGPISFNYLIGTYNIFAGRRLGSDNAFAIQSVKADLQPLGGPNGFSFTPGLTQDFAEIGGVLVSDFRANPASTVGSRLLLLDIGAALGKRNPISSVLVDFWNSAEEPFSSSWEFVCWTEASLDQIDANFLADNLGTTHGSMRVESALSCPVAGLCPPFLPRAPLLLGVIQENETEAGLRQQAALPELAAETGGAGIRSMQSIPCNDGDPASVDYFDPSTGCAAIAPFRQDCDAQKTRASRVMNDIHLACKAACRNVSECELGCDFAKASTTSLIDLKLSACVQDPTKSCGDFASEDALYCQTQFTGNQNCIANCGGNGFGCENVCLEAVNCNITTSQSADFCQRSKCIAEGGTSETCPTGFVQDCDKQIDEMASYKSAAVNDCINNRCGNLAGAAKTSCINGCNTALTVLDTLALPALRGSCESIPNSSCDDIRTRQLAHPCSPGLNFNECGSAGCGSDQICKDACIEVAGCTRVIDALYAVCQAQAT